MDDERPFKSLTCRSCSTADGGGRRAGAGAGQRCRASRGRQAVAEGTNIIILSDRGVDAGHAADPGPAGRGRRAPPPDPRGTRTKVSLVLESGEPREVHHFALLIGYGAGAINPYLAFETIDDMVRQGHPARASTQDKAVKNYIKAVNKGVIKVMSKMGISTVQSYRGAQIFEAVGLDQDVIDKYFTCTPSRVGGIGLDVSPRRCGAALPPPSPSAPPN